MARARDIDYAAATVKKAIVEKFSDVDLTDLQVIAGDTTISVEHKGRVAESTRHDLLTAIREATSYANLWEVLANDGNRTG